MVTFGFKVFCLSFVTNKTKFQIKRTYKTFLERVCYSSIVHVLLVHCTPATYQLYMRRACASSCALHRSLIGSTCVAHVHPSSWDLANLISLSHRPRWLSRFLTCLVIDWFEVRILHRIFEFYSLIHPDSENWWRSCISWLFQ